ncbi:MAG: YitT family protein [Bradymonadales bacterium]
MFFKSSTLKRIVDYFMITLGSFALALGIAVFMLDANIVPGGVTGISMAINYLTDISVGKLIWILNVPLFIWGVIELGSAFGVRTFYGFTTNAFFIDLIRGDIPGFEHVQWNKLSFVQFMLEHDFFFLVLIGSILTGIGLGVVFKFKGTTAGTEIVSAILKKRFGIKPGMAILYVDFFIIIGAGIVIYITQVSDRPVIYLIIYALLGLYVSSIILDKIVFGFDYAKNMMIFSRKNDEIANYIKHDMERGVTAFYAKGMYAGKDRDVLMTVVSPSEARDLTNYIKELDANSFVILSNVDEVIGEGFRRREEVDLQFIRNAEEREREREAAELAAAQATQRALLAEAVAERADQDAQAALQKAHQQAHSPESAEAQRLAKLAQDTADLAKQDAQKARQNADRLVEVASSIENIVEFHDNYHEH